MLASVWLRVKLILGLVIVMVVIHLVNVAMDGQLIRFGVIPRDGNTWFHVLTAPFIHGSYGHLMNNLIGLSIFSTICLLRSVRFFIVSSLFIIIVSGALVWYFGRAASHVGASGWIFGLWALSIAMALFDRSFKNIVIALFVVFLYGGMIYGVLPTDPRVSFEFHLFGLIAGGICAFCYRFFTKNRSSNLEISQ